VPPIRPPAVAGRFYPGNPAVLSAMVDGFIDRTVTPIPAIGVIVPHAGYIYSGDVAGVIYSQVAIPSRTIILCPNHTGYGVPLSIMCRGAWQTPLGNLQIDSEMADALVGANPALEEDTEAHRLEHAIEVQLPFLQRGPETSFGNDNRRNHPERRPDNAHHRFQRYESLRIRRRHATERCQGD